LDEEKIKVYSDDPFEDVEQRYNIFHKKFDEAFEEMGGAPAISIVTFAFDLLEMVIDKFEEEDQSVRKLKAKSHNVVFIDFFRTRRWMLKELKRFWKRVRRLGSP